MKTVLTIDFDIIMDSYTELYNHLEYMPWEIRLNNLAGLREMPCNAFHYEKIMNLLFTLFKLLNKEKIHFIKQHHSIFHLLDKNFKYNIINIDHHHDWFYQMQYDKEKNNLNCGNWVQCCYLNDLLNSYTWIKNETSIIPQFLNDEDKNIDFKEYNLKFYDLMNLPQIDELFICFSPEYVPPYYYPLFFIMMNACSSYYNKQFNFED